MLEPKTPLNELQRLQAVKDLCLTQSSSDPGLIRITELTARLFNTDIALVTIMGDQKQIFKSAYGTDITEIPRSHSFCGHVIYEEQPMVIEDTLQDHRFMDHPLVHSAPFIRFYAGQPLKSPSGFMIGTLCLMDAKPRKFAAIDLRNLQDLAGIAENQIKFIADATTDDLTNLLNKRGFYSLARKNIAIAMRSELKVSLAVLTLTGLKQLNNEFDHALSDRVLRIFADALSQSTRKTDIIARLDSVKFAVLSIDKNSDDLDQIRTRLETTLAEKVTPNSPIKTNLDFNLTSVQFEPQANIDLEQIIATAEGKLN